MTFVLFCLFSLIMVGFGLAVVVSRNPVGSALCMVVSFLGLAALFILLDAYFIGIIQVLVYAGAIMVLFLFIIMLLDLKTEEKRRFPIPAFIAGTSIALLILWQLLGVVDALGDAGSRRPPELDFKVAATARADELGKGYHEDAIFTRLNAEVPSLPDIRLIGEQLFTRFPLHLQVVAVLLLVSTIGVVVLSKRRLN